MGSSCGVPGALAVAPGDQGGSWGSSAVPRGILRMPAGARATLGDSWSAVRDLQATPQEPKIKPCQQRVVLTAAISMFSQIIFGNYSHYASQPCDFTCKTAAPDAVTSISLDTVGHVLEVPL